MNIGLLTSTNPQLRQQLEANGLSDAKAELVEGDVVAVAKARPTGNTAPSTGFTSMRAALDARIAADVSSGKLTESDAAAVKKTLDEIDSQSDGSASSDQSAQTATTAAPDNSSGGAGKAGGGGGGGGGSSSKTEKSETVTVAGAIKTTIITYTDGTTSTTTTTATQQDQAKYGPHAADNSRQQTAKYYLATVERGTLIDRIA